jgi:methyl-accepting chemotaxis protein
MLGNVRLGVKLGLGFGLMLTLTCALGLLAVMTMSAGREAGTGLAREHLPEVRLAAALERQALVAMDAVGAFALSEDPKRLGDGQAALAAARDVLAEAEDLAARHPGLAGLKDNAAKAGAALTRFAGLTEETRSLLAAIGKDRALMDRAGAEFAAACDAFLAAQIELAGQPDGAQKLKAMQAVVGLGNNVTTGYFKGQALRDPGVLAQAQALFPQIEAMVDEMAGNSVSMQDIMRLETVRAATAAYKDAVADFLGYLEKLETLDRVRGEAAYALLEAARETSAGGLARAQDIADRTADELSSAVTVLLAGLGLAVLLGALAAVLLTRAVTRPVAREAAFAARVAEGDLDQVLDVDQNDEIGLLAKSMSHMVARLKDMIRKSSEQESAAREAAGMAEEAMARAKAKEGEVRVLLEKMDAVAGEARAIAERVAEASEELSVQAGEISSGAEEQRARIGETAVAMEQMNAAVLEVAKSSGEASRIAGQAKSRARQGAEVVGQAVAGIGGVHRATDELRAHMAELGDKARSIGAILEVIADIADQTNLLALNAAIEAARAGDAGRGFAVVADEVRKLAEKTMAATGQVAESIRAIQEAARLGMERMGRAEGAVEQVTGLAERSGAALDEIVVLVDGSAGQISGIATAAEEQSATAEQISGSIDAVNRIVGATADGMARSAKAIRELAAMSAELKALISTLKDGRAASAGLAG